MAFVHCVDHPVLGLEVGVFENTTEEKFSPYSLFVPYNPGRRILLYLKQPLKDRVVRSRHLICQCTQALSDIGPVRDSIFEKEIAASQPVLLEFMYYTAAENGFTETSITSKPEEGSATWLRFLP